MSTLERNVVVSPEEYLEGELHSHIRHEYVAGRLYAMTGASEAHNLIAGNLYALLHRQLRGTPCRVFIADLKLRVEDAFYYPDLMVVCDRQDAHPYYKTRPRLVAEVLSPSTERRDSVEKRVAYQTIAALQEYLLIAQERPEVRIFRRGGEGWDLETCTGDDRLRLASLDIDLLVNALYEGVEL